MTADCITSIVSTAKQALHYTKMAVLLLQDIQSAFDSFPHASIITIPTLGVEGELLNYVQAFVTSRTFTVHVGGATNMLCAVSCRVSQDSVLSLFLFIWVLVPLTKCLPETAMLPVHSAVYADDVALKKYEPTRKGSVKRTCMQEVLQCAAIFVRSSGFMISALKTKASLFILMLRHDDVSCVFS
ncbi:hypothetical protein MRX96_050219 [Rhipicephalus microplus]